MAVQGDISFGLSIGAGQSVRRNAGDSAFEAYTPSSGVSWGTSINGATGTGLALALDNSYAASGIGQSITIGNTQTNGLTGLKIDTGTSAVTSHIALNILSPNSPITNGALSINSYGSNTQAINNNSIGMVIARNFNGNSTKSFAAMYINVDNNASTGRNTGIIVANNASVFSAGVETATNFTGASFSTTISGSGSVGYHGIILNSTAASTTGIAYYKIGDTQAAAHVAQKIDLGTSAQGHTGLLINQFNTSFSSTGLKIDRSTTGTGYGLSIVGGGLGNNGRLINGTYTANGTLTAKTEKDYEFATTRLHTGATTITDNFDMCSYTRTNRTNGASSNLTSQGSVLKLENVVTQTAGTLTDSVTPLLIVQDADSTGVPIAITQNAVVSTNYRKLINESATGITIWMGNGTTANGTLSGTAGDILINGGSNKPEYCTGTTNWTALV